MVALAAAACPLAPVIWRGRAIRGLFAVGAQRLVAAIAVEPAVLWNPAAVRADAWSHDRVAAWQVRRRAHRLYSRSCLGTRGVLRAARIVALIAEALLWPILALAAAVVLILAARGLARVTPADALAVAELCRAAAGLAALYNSRDVLRAERIVAIVADLVAALVVHLAAANVLLGIGRAVVALNAEVVESKIRHLVALWLAAEVDLLVQRGGREPDMLALVYVIVVPEDDGVEVHLALSFKELLSLKG